MLHCDLRVRWKVASDLRFRAAISEPKTPSFCGISGDLAPSTRKSLAIAIVRSWCAKERLEALLEFRPGWSTPYLACLPGDPANLHPLPLKDQSCCGNSRGREGSEAWQAPEAAAK